MQSVCLFTEMYCSKVAEFFLFAILMTSATVVFAIMSYYYEYAHDNERRSPGGDDDLNSATKRSNWNCFLIDRRCIARLRHVFTYSVHVDELSIRLNISKYNQICHMQHIVWVVVDYDEGLTKNSMSQRWLYVYYVVIEKQIEYSDL